MSREVIDAPFRVVETREAPPSLRDPVLDAMWARNQAVPGLPFLVWYGFSFLFRLIGRGLWHLGWRRRRSRVSVGAGPKVPSEAGPSR